MMIITTETPSRIQTILIPVIRIIIIAVITAGTVIIIIITATATKK